MPSIIASKIYNLIQAKSFQYIDYVADTKKKNDSETIETEKWNKENKRKRSNESFYFNNHDFFKLGKGIKYNFDSVECTEFEKAYSGYINNRISSENRLPAEAQKATDFLPQAQAPSSLDLFLFLACQLIGLIRTVVASIIAHSNKSIENILRSYLIYNLFHKNF